MKTKKKVTTAKKIVKKSPPKNKQSKGKKKYKKLTRLESILKEMKEPIKGPSPDWFTKEEKAAHKSGNSDLFNCDDVEIVCVGNVIQEVFPGYDAEPVRLTDIFFLSGDGFCGRNLMTQYKSLVLNVASGNDKTLNLLVGRRIEAKGFLKEDGSFTILEWKNSPRKEDESDDDSKVIELELEEEAPRKKSQVDFFMKDHCDTFIEEGARKKEIPSVQLSVYFKDGLDKLCTFDFFEQCVSSKRKSTFIAECNGVYGGGQNWSLALVNCIEKMAREGMLVS